MAVNNPPEEMNPSIATDASAIATDTSAIEASTAALVTAANAIAVLAAEISANTDSVEVGSMPSVDVATMPPVVVSEIPDNPQKYFGSDSQVVSRDISAGVGAFVLPSDNVNGVVVYNACVGCAAGSPLAVSIMFGSSAPLGYLDGNLLCVSNNTSGSGVYSSFSGPVFIPAGLGLYSYLSGSNCNASVIYEVL